MSLTDSIATRSISPPSLPSAEPVGEGASPRGPLGPSTTGRPPARNGSLSGEVA
jgi:hypothetical protein